MFWMILLYLINSSIFALALHYCLRGESLRFQIGVQTFVFAFYTGYFYDKVISQFFREW